MAFVNKREDDQAQDVAGAGQLIDFDPFDPDVVKVHYDLSAWGFDARAELSERLADGDLAHGWDGDELIVPEELESQVDVLCEEIEEELGPFAIVLEADEESTEFGLDEWTDADRKVLTEALVASEVPHRWEGTTVIVAADAEDAVDDLLDAIEAGELLAAGDDGVEPPDNVLSTLFLAADRLAKDPTDLSSRRTLIDLQGELDRRHPPYAFNPRVWVQALDGQQAIIDRIHAEATGPEDDGEASDVIGLAQELRSLLRPYV